MKKYFCSLMVLLIFVVIGAFVLALRAPFVDALFSSGVFFSVGFFIFLVWNYLNIYQLNMSFSPNVFLPFQKLQILSCDVNQVEKMIEDSLYEKNVKFTKDKNIFLLPDSLPMKSFVITFRTKESSTIILCKHKSRFVLWGGYPTALIMSYLDLKRLQ